MQENTELGQITATYNWHRALGNISQDTGLARFVTNPQTPDVWVANHVQNVRVVCEQDMNTLLAQIDRAFVHCTHRLIFIDPQCSQRVSARLLADGYSELDPTIQMILTGTLSGLDPLAGLSFEVIQSDSGWDDLYHLMRADHLEGKRSFGLTLEDEITRGLVADMRRKVGPSTVYLARMDGQAVAYGAGIDGPFGPGMIEDLFTLPSWRGRGIASRLIAHATGILRATQANRPVFLGALALQGAKHLYRRLGFEPVMVSREFLLNPE